MTVKSKTTTLALILTLLSTSTAPLAQATCLDLYKRKIEEMDSRMNAPRTAVILNSGTAAVATPTLYSAGVVSMGSLLLLPAAALAAGTYFGILALQKKSTVQAYLAIRQAEVGSGPVLSRLFRKVNSLLKKKHMTADLDQVRAAVMRLNEKNAFCEENQSTGKIQFSRFRALTRRVASELN